MEESRIITDGQALGYEADRLVKYVEERRKREEKKVVQDTEREERRIAREEQKSLRDLEVLKAENELKQAQLALAQNGGGGGNIEGSTKANIKLAPYSDGDDIGVYLRNFERVRDANKWNADLAITALINGFSGTKVSLFLNTMDTVNYVELKPLLLQSFGMSIYDIQNKLRFAKQSNESMSQFALMLRDYVTKICGLADIGSSFEKLRDFIIKDQILRSVDISMASFLKENEIFSTDLDEVIKLAENYQAIHGRSRAVKPIQRSNVNQIDNVKPKQMGNGTSAVGTRVCFQCGKPGHLARYCNVKFSNFVGDRHPDKVERDGEYSYRNNHTQSAGSRMCYVCKDPGHIAKDCPRRNVSKCDQTREVPIKANREFVNNCQNIEVISVNMNGNNEHVGRLPVAHGKCNGRSVKVLRDTGCSSVVVKPWLVKPDFYTGKFKEVRYGDGFIKSLPLVRVQLKCPYYEGVYEALCDPGIPFDVVVGQIKGAKCACISVCDVKSCAVSDEDEIVDVMCSVQTRNQVIREKLPPRKSNVGVGTVQLDMTEVTSKELISLQREDGTLNSMFQKVGTITNSYPKFSLRNGVLIRSANSSKNLKDMLHQIVIPHALRKRVISLAHDTVLSGHLGIGKTKKRVMSHFYWPGITADITRYCRSCAICQKNYCVKPPKVPLINLPIIDIPFSRIAIDLIGPLPKSAKGNRYALVTIDLATKYPDAVPLKHIDSHTVAEALLDIFSRVGLPREILHDQGTQFMSSVMKRFNNLLQIKSINTSPYNPQCNGTCENFNKTLKQMIKKICNDDPEMWDKFIQPLLFAYREVPQVSTGFSPFELIFGHNVRGPLFLIKERLLEPDDVEQIPVTKYVMDMREKIRNFMQLSNENESVSKRKQKVYYDRKTRKRNYKLGDKVLLLLPTSTNKLLAEWKGPFEVVRRINDVDYVIRIMDKERVYHVNMLKPFYERATEDLVKINVLEGKNETERYNNCLFNMCPSLSKLQSLKLVEHLDKFENVFSDKPGKVSGVQYEIEMNKNVKPVASLPYKIPFQLKDQVKATLEQWLELGIIRESRSSWASPAVIVRNNDETIRVTVDYRKVNPHVNVDNFPMPDRDVVIEKLSNSKFLSKLDLTKAYLQIPLTESSCKYTSFVTEFGQYEFTVVPFGIRFASGLCNRIINNVLGECKSFITSFVDDLMIYSDTYEQHLEHINTVLNKLFSAGITLNKNKCKFAFNRVKFLGFIVGNGKVSPDPAKISAIREFPIPVDKKHLRSFLGLLNFYRKFIVNLSDFIAPLTSLLRKECADKILWTTELTDCFCKAKNMLSDDIDLFIPRKDKSFMLQTDASNAGIGAVLAQEIDGEFRPISFISRKLNKAENNYAVIEKE